MLAQFYSFAQSYCLVLDRNDNVVEGPMGAKSLRTLQIFRNGVAPVSAKFEGLTIVVDSGFWADLVLNGRYRGLYARSRPTVVGSISTIAARIVNSGKLPLIRKTISFYLIYSEHC